MKGILELCRDLAEMRRLEKLTDLELANELIEKCVRDDGNLVLLCEVATRLDPKWMELTEQEKAQEAKR